MAISKSYSTAQLRKWIDDLSVLYDFDELDRDELVAGAIRLSRSCNTHAHTDVALLALVDRLVAQQRYRRRDLRNRS